MKEAIREAAHAGDTLGGVFEVVATGVLPGLGSHVQWDRKLDGRLAQALMSIQAIKGVEIGARLRRGAGRAGRRCTTPSTTTASAAGSRARRTAPAASRGASPTASRSCAAPR